MTARVHSIHAGLLALLLLLFSCGKDNPPEPGRQHTPAVTELISLMVSNPDVKALLEKSISQAAAVNPDRRYNPAQSLEEFYEFVDWNVRQLPWDVMITASPTEYGQSLYGRADQGVGYFWFIVDQPLDELKDRGYYYPNGRVRGAFRLVAHHLRFLLGGLALYPGELEQQLLQDCCFRPRLGTFEGLV